VKGGSSENTNAYMWEKGEKSPKSKKVYVRADCEKRRRRDSKGQKERKLVGKEGKDSKVWVVESGLNKEENEQENEVRRRVGCRKKVSKRKQARKGLGEIRSPLNPSREKDCRDPGGEKRRGEN